MYPLFTTGSISSELNMLFAIFIGIAFGFILERAGFGKSTNIASVFYFKNLRVAQTMVSAIITASFLLVITVYFGVLDFNQIYIPTTYVWPYLVGGALFGFGMIMAGWCPGTAVVGFATGKIDAAMFLLGLLVGMLIYFQQFEKIIDFANSGNLGKFTISKFIGGNIYTSLVITIFLGICLLIFMNKMKSIRNKKEGK